jgi:hypothetical protein
MGSGGLYGDGDDHGRFWWPQLKEIAYVSGFGYILQRHGFSGGDLSGLKRGRQ